MVKTFTFVEPSRWSKKKSAVYRGSFDGYAHVPNRTPDFQATVDHRDLSLSIGTDEKSVLSGRLEGFSKRRLTIAGQGSSVTGKYTGLRQNLEFSDFSGRKYTWKQSAFSSKLNLEDASGNKIATFTHVHLSLRVLGHLELQRDVDDTLLCLILLTCKLELYRQAENSRSSSSSNINNNRMSSGAIGSTTMCVGL
ncbi:hypothetical protein GQ54DRAFT_52175 [Martensiomyces pterosporus]|nr:hypothetical protein GQ54DRAFT_52175 [Martensiomyces pterosporus]